MPRWFLLAALALLTAGCGQWGTVRTGKNPLTQPRMSPDSVGIEIAWLRHNVGDVDIEQTMWSDVDEQCFSSEIRQQLSENGLRVGVVGQQLPMTLTQLIQSQAAETTQEGNEQEQLAQKVEEDIGPSRRRIHIRAGRRKELIATNVQDVFHVMLREEGQIRGRSFENAQGVFSLKTFPRGDGRVRIEITPEVHHGAPRQEWRGGGELFMLEVNRARETFANLKLDLVLSAGQQLILTARPEMPGSLGQRLLADSAAEGRMKVLLVRLVQTQHDDLFQPPAESYEE